MLIYFLVESVRILTEQINLSWSPALTELIIIFIKVNIKLL